MRAIEVALLRPALLHGCCTEAPAFPRAFSYALHFSCKTVVFQREKRPSRRLRERHKDKEQGACAFYSTEALIRRSLVKHSPQAYSSPAKQ